ncbi:thiamine-binding protein [Subtercola sp. PAMC28395]|uniref:thiamine-binding protein n=1 Tax=Subtercola sp. PAMC28395 TaxID=2846775 RepID=UPI001C0C200B|nr:thiamine-binding protein [Subtercola sp. PAMC28395]QWT23616.1 thiamine-binding protein [Subtercola sp. PAMC28395]
MLVAFSVAPSGVGIRSRSVSTTTSAGDSVAETAADDASVHDAVAAAVRIVRDSGLPNHTDSMFTTIEGSWDEVFEVVRRATEAVAEYGSRVSLVLKADIRPGFEGELSAKVERLERALDHS